MIHPSYILGGGALLVYLVARLVTRRNSVLASITAASYALALASIWGSAQGPLCQTLAPSNGTPSGIAADAGACLVATVALALGLAVAIYSGRYLSLDRRYENYYPLLLLLGVGIVGMVSVTDLFTLYLLSVLTSATSCILVAFRRQTATAIEAGYKYVIMASMASMIMLAGVGFVFRETGVLSLGQPLTSSVWHRLGVMMILFGLLVKAAIFPAHTWLPDAYGRAPSSVSAMLAGIVGETYLYLLVRTALGLGLSATWLGWLLLTLAVLNATVGNVMALRQEYGKRLLGYSSIAQVGYMSAAIGVGLIHGAPEAIAAGLFLLICHAAMKALAFLAKGTLHYYCDASRLEDLDGIYRRAPLTSILFGLGLAGLLGIPPLAGFVAKYQILFSLATIQPGAATVALISIIANILISVGYYVPVIGRMLAHTDEHTVDRPSISLWMQIPTLTLGCVVLLLGLLAGPVLAFSHRAALALLSWGMP
jgi:proton-translocating NADH-quinone oxidoreductase chain N